MWLRCPCRKYSTTLKTKPRAFGVTAASAAAAYQFLPAAAISERMKAGGTSTYNGGYRRSDNTVNNDFSMGEYDPSQPEKGGIGDLEAALNCTTAGLELVGPDVTTQAGANLAIDRLDTALAKVSMVRSSFGAAQNRPEHKIDNLNNTVENLTRANALPQQMAGLLQTFFVLFAVLFSSIFGNVTHLQICIC